MAKKKGFSTVFLSFLALVVGLVASFSLSLYLTLPKTDVVNVSDEVYYSNDPAQDINIDPATFGADLSIHFLELGNKYTGDCTLIQTKTCDILIDCGSKSNSIPTISNYLNKFVTDGKLEYVIVTHAHQDHYAGFATSTKMNSIFDLYECQNIITFAGTAKGKKDTTMYKNFERELADEVAAGANHYTALDCVTGANGAQSSFEIGEGINLQILDSEYYAKPDTSNENNNSVCCLITQNFESGTQRNFLFTGDLEAEGEHYLVEKNSLPIVDLYKAGHHGSKTSSSAELLSVIQPKIVCVCCCAGSPEYTKVSENQFPTQEFIDRVALYTNRVYVTTLCVDYAAGKFQSFNGNIIYLSNAEKDGIACTNNNTLLKDSDWFKNNRTCPDPWKN